MSISAHATVEILRIGHASAKPEPEEVERRHRKTPEGLLVEFT